MREMQNILSATLAASACVAISEFNLVNSRTARVIATVVGRPNRETLFQGLTATLKNATPIKSSFRWLDSDNRYMTGFVAVNPEVRIEDEQDFKAKYRHTAANLYMDSGDESLWELREGASGKFLARQGQDNLAELLEASRVSPKGSTPRMYSIMPATAKKHEMLAYVATDSNVVEIDYGFCVDIGMVQNERAYRVVSTTCNAPLTIRESAIVGAYRLPTEEMPQVVGQKLTAATDTATSIEYYRKAYSYSPDYIEKIIKQINEMASL